MGKKVDKLKADAPKVDAPKVDAPKADAPKVDAPKVDAPKADAPKVDAPKADAPKVDAPKKAVKSGAKYSDDIAEFFKNYPNAPLLIKAGDCLFLTTHKGSAIEYGKRIGVDIEEIENPNL
jgi:hypothetical protein